MRMMSVPIAYLAVLIIWASTPLAISWSADAGFVYSVTLRMGLGVLLVLVFALARGISLNWSKEHRPLYLISGLSIFVAMFLTYWASQYIPSGWISVVFGLMPLLTAVFSYFLLNDRSMTVTKTLGLLLAVIGLGLVCATGYEMGRMVLWGIVAMLVATSCQAIGAVLLKRYNHSLTGMEINVGGLLIAVPCFVISGIVTDIDWTPEVNQRAALSILYLAMVATAVGFSLYFFLLKQVSPLRISLISLVTPFMTLLIGHWLNDEVLSARVWLGASLIALGLLMFEFKGLALRLRVQRLG